MRIDHADAGLHAAVERAADLRARSAEHGEGFFQDRPDFGYRQGVGDARRIGTRADREAGRSRAIDQHVGVFAAEF